MERLGTPHLTTVSSPVVQDTYLNASALPGRTRYMTTDLLRARRERIPVVVVLESNRRGIRG